MPSAGAPALLHARPWVTVTAVHLPYFLRRVNRVFTNPLLGTVAWILPPMAVIHHVGRKSGRDYRTPVLAFRSSGGFVVPMTYGRDVDWGRNILKARKCELTWLGRRHALRTPRIVDGKEAYAHLPTGVRSVPRAATLPGFVLLDQATKSRRKRK